MAETTIPTNGTDNNLGKGKGYDAAQQDARDEMAEALKTSVFDPLGLLCGLLASLKDEEDDGAVYLKTVGHLFGLVVNGAHKELEIQQMGGRGAYWLHQLLEGHDKV